MINIHCRVGVKCFGMNLSLVIKQRLNIFQIIFAKLWYCLYKFQAIFKLIIFKSIRNIFTSSWLSAKYCEKYSSRRNPQTSQYADSYSEFWRSNPTFPICSWNQNRGSFLDSRTVKRDCVIPRSTVPSRRVK